VRITETPCLPWLCSQNTTIAKHNHREDIRFFAFEPNEKKYQHIKHIVKLNQLNITVFQTCVGYVRGKASNDNVVPSFTGATSYKLNQDGEYDII
jgi:hypothetical protein